jgi:hypothetical protein
VQGSIAAPGRMAPLSARDVASIRMPKEHPLVCALTKITVKRWVALGREQAWALGLGFALPLSDLPWVGQGRPAPSR